MKTKKHPKPMGKPKKSPPPKHMKGVNPKDRGGASDKPTRFGRGQQDET